MTEDRRHFLIEDIVEGLAHGAVADGSAAFRIARVDEGTVTIDLGEPGLVYIVTVTGVERTAEA